MVNGGKAVVLGEMEITIEKHCPNQDGQDEGMIRIKQLT
jgi:hypothetical protein